MSLASIFFLLFFTNFLAYGDESDQLNDTVDGSIASSIGEAVATVTSLPVNNAGKELGKGVVDEYRSNETGPRSQNACANILEIIKVGEFTNFANSPDYKQCEMLPMNFSNENELKGPDGCACVKEKNNPLDCDTFGNFLSLFRNNYEEIYKEEILTTAMRDLEMLALKHVPPEPMCDVTQELRECTFPEEKLTLNDIIGKHFEDNRGINSIDDFKDHFKAKEHNKSILMIHDYEALISTMNSDPHFNSLKDWQKEYILQSIKERESELTEEIISMGGITDRFLSKAESMMNVAATNTSVGESKFLATHALMDVGRLGVITASGEEVQMNLSNTQEVDEDNDWSDYSWRELANYFKKTRVYPRKKIKRFLREREEHQIQRMIKKNNLLCKKTKEKIATNCEVVKEIDEGKISPPGLIALNKPESISILRDLAHGVIPTNKGPEEKEELQQEIDYVLEWFICASNAQFSSEDDLNSFVNYDNCSTLNDIVIEQLQSQSNRETYHNFHHGVVEDYYSYKDLSADEIEQIEKHSNNVVETFKNEGLISDPTTAPNTQRAVISDSSNAPESIKETQSSISSSTQDSGEGSSAASYDPYTKSSMSSFNNSTPTTSSEDTSNEGIENTVDQQENDIVQNLLAELDKKREELAKLKEELEEAKKEKDQESTKEISDDIAQTQQEIKTLEDEVKSITDSNIGTEDTDIAESGLDDGTAATREPSSTNSTIPPTSTGASGLSSGGGASSVTTTSINPSSAISSSSQTAFDYSNVTEQYLEDLPNTKKIDVDLSMMGMSVKNGYVSIGKSANGDDVLVIFSKESESISKGNAQKEYVPLIELSLSVGSGVSSILSGTPKEFRKAVLEVYKKYFNLKDEDLSDVLAKRKPAKATSPKERSVRYEDFTKTNDDLKN